MAAHHKVVGFGGEPTGTETAMSAPEPPPDGQMEPPFAVTATRTPMEVLYTVVAEYRDIAPVDNISGSPSCFPIPPRLSASVRYMFPSLLKAATRLEGVAPGTWKKTGLLALMSASEESIDAKLVG